MARGLKYEKCAVLIWASGCVLLFRLMLTVSSTFGVETARI